MKVKVPDGMWVAVDSALNSRSDTNMSPNGWATIGVKAAFAWLSENRQDMSRPLLAAIRKDVSFLDVNETNIYEIVNAALRRMFRDPEPEVPEEVKDLLVNPRSECGERRYPSAETLNAAVIEAYRRGQKAGKP